MGGTTGAERTVGLVERQRARLGGIVIADPAAELVDLVERGGDQPAPAVLASARLLRRRFGVTLPVSLAGDDRAVGIGPARPAEVGDGPAVAAVRWRAFVDAHRHRLPADRLRELANHPPTGYWTGLAMVPPSPDHILMVTGDRGWVSGLVAARPAGQEDVAQGGSEPIAEVVPGGSDDGGAVVGEVHSCYVEPVLHRNGLARRLATAALGHLAERGFDEAVLWVIDGDDRAAAFWSALGARPDGRHGRFEIVGVELTETRWRIATGGPGP